MFTLSFGYSASKNYQKAVDMAHDIGGKMDNGTLVILIPDYELLRAYEYVWPILQIIQNWKTVAGDYNGKKVDPFKFLYTLWRTVGDCAQQRNDTWDTRHCWQDNDHQGWGCCQIYSILAHNFGSGIYTKSNRFWYNYGEFESKYIWKINKELLFERAKKEIETNSLTVCPFFDIANIKAAIEELPDRIFVDNVSYVPYYNESNQKVNIRHLPEMCNTNSFDDFIGKWIYSKN